MSNASKTVVVRTGSRLHFGLTRYRAVLGEGKYNGVGVMIESPATELEFQLLDSPTEPKHRADHFAIKWQRSLSTYQRPISIRVLNCPTEHSGLGSGTQLAHAVAVGINQLLDQPNPSAEQVAQALDRGQRSMIGSYGFSLGGLIVEGSANQTKPVGRLAHRIALPLVWHAVLALHHQAHKKFGVQERTAFDNINAEQTSRARALEDLIDNQLVPAAETSDFVSFCESVQQFGRLSGEYYSAVQGGIYNGPVITAVVETFARLGGTGIGQSSWGPVVYSWCPDAQSANELVHRLNNHFSETQQPVSVWSSPIRNQMASVETLNHVYPGND